MAKRSSSKTSRRYAQEDSAYWQQHFQQFANSNLTRKAYCRKNKINYDRFQYWYKKYKVANENASVKAIPVTLKAVAPNQLTLCTLACSNGALLRVHDTKALQYILNWLA